MDREREEIARQIGQVFRQARDSYNEVYEGHRDQLRNHWLQVTIGMTIDCLKDWVLAFNKVMVC